MGDVEIGQDDEYGWGDPDRAEVVPFVPMEVRRLLDVGCGRGGFGAALKRRRADMVVWGIEPSEAGAMVAATRLDRVIRSEFPGPLPRQAAPFDCVTFNDVLEHMADPAESLRAAGAVLRPGGYVVASIPNVRYVEVLSDLVLRGRWTYTETGVLDRTHLRFFTRSSMVTLFEECGYAVRRVAPINTGFSKGRPARLLRRFGKLFDDVLAPQFVVLAVGPSDAGDPTPPRATGLPGRPRPS